MLKRIRRCKHCGAEMSVKPQEWNEYPFCLGCLPERLEATRLAQESVVFVMSGHYIMATTTCETPAASERLLQRR